MTSRIRDILDPPKNHMTPLEIGMCAHYAGCCGDYQNQHAPAVAEFMQKMRRYGLLEETSYQQRLEEWGLWKGTPKLRAFVALMGETPMPEPTWVDPRTRKEIR